MKKILSLSVICSFFLLVGQINFASINQEQESETVEVTESMQEVEQSVAEEPQSIGFTQELKNRFIEGGPGFMGIVLACLILGLAIAIERIIYLNFATTNTDKLISDVDTNLIKNVKIFDVFSGESMPVGKKSIAINVLIQSKEKTLSQKDLDDISQKIIDIVKAKTGGTIRS